MLGLIAAPILRMDGVLLTGSSESLQMLLWNFIGGCVLFGYNLVAAFLQFWTLHKLGILRVAAEAEISGLDILKHNEPAYDYGILLLIIKPLLGYAYGCNVIYQKIFIFIMLHP